MKHQSPFTTSFSQNRSDSPSFSNSLPKTGFLRLPQIIGNPKADPPIPALIPISKSSWWKGVKEGRFPASLKLSARTTVWRAADIYKLIEGNGEVQP